MNRFRKKSETRRPQALEDQRLIDLSRSASTSPGFQQNRSNNPSGQYSNSSSNLVTVAAATTSAPPALPALSTGVEFRTSLIFPDLTRSFQHSGKPAHIPESKIRSKLAQQRLHGAQEERITEEEEEVMFAALSSIQGIRRARGNSSASANNSTPSSNASPPAVSPGNTSVELLYPESIGSGGRSPGMSSTSSPGLVSAFPDTPAVGGNTNVEAPSIYPFASLSSQSSHSSTSSSSRRLSNNLFGSSRFRDVSYMRGQRSRNVSGTNASVASGSPNSSAAAIALTTSDGVFEELSSASASPSPSPIEPHSSSSTSSVSFAPTPAQQGHGYGHGQMSDKEKTPVARPTRLPLPQTPNTLPVATLPNGTPLTAAQIRRISVALDRAISAIAENDHEADDDEEQILAPHSVPLGGGFLTRSRPPTAFNDPSNPIEVSDLNAVLMYLETSRQSQSHAQSIHSLTHTRESSTSSPVPVSSTPTPGYVPGMNRPISPRDFSTSNSGHDSEDYSTTPRATSPVTSFNRGGGGGGVLAPRRQQNNNGAGYGNSSGRPSTAPTRGGMGTNSGTSSPGDWRGQYLQGGSADPSNGANGLERSLSNGQGYDRRYQSQSPAGDSTSNGVNQHVVSAYTHRRRPSSPLAHEHYTAASLSAINTSTSLAGAAAALQRSMDTPTTASSSTDSESDTQVQAPRGTMTMAQAQANGRAANAPMPPASTSASDADHGTEIANGQGLSREKSLTRSMTGPSLPDSPMIDDDPFRNDFPLPAMQNWAFNLERQIDPSSTTSTPPAVGNLIMPQPTQRMPVLASSVPHIARSQTPNNIARTDTPVATPAIAIPNVVIASQTSPVARVGTPNYLVQRSPSANGFPMDYNQDAADNSGRRAVSPRPITNARAGTLSHTPSTSSTSAYNPMLHSSLGSSSRASTGSAGSSYHSSDEGEGAGRFREAANWLFDPESKGSTFVSARARTRKGTAGDGDDSSNERESKDDASDSIGDQEDVLQLLTGLTKRDLSSIQQKLVSAAVAREAEDAIRLSQRRRRPSVQSRDFVNATPKPQVTTQAEPVVQQSIPVVINRIQSPAPEVRPEPEILVTREEIQEAPIIVARPISPVGEPPIVYTITEEFEVPSAATTPPQIELDIAVTPPPPADQSPRAKALAEALFGGEPPESTATASPPRRNQSAEELHDEVERKVIAATVALKSPSLTVDGGSPLRRKSTKRIDLQKISGPQLVSASMSVDAIPLASPSMTSLGAMGLPQEGTKTGSGIGSRLRRLHHSLRTKNNNPSGHEREHSGASSTVIHETSSAGLTQVVDYYPQGLQAPQVRSVPPHGGDSLSGVKSSVTSAGPTTPPATAGPAGLKGFITRLRQPKGGSIRRAEGSPRPAVSMQPSAFLSSPHLNENEPTAPRTIPVMARSHPSESMSIPSVSTQTPDEALRQLFTAANNLGLDPAALNELLSNRAASQASKAAPWASPSDSRPGTSAQRYDDSSSSSWTTAQNSAAPSRQQSTRVKIEPTARLRPAREGGNPQSAVVRRTIIYPSTAASSSGSPLPGQARSTGGVQRKMSTASNSKRRPMSFQSQFSAKSVHDRTPTPPPPRGAAAKRMSQDGLPPMPSSIFSSSGRPGTSAGIINDGLNGTGSIDMQESSPDPSALEDGRALQVIELENGEVIWSVLDTLRSPGDELDDDSNYFSNRGSFASHYSAATNDPLQVSFRGLGRSASRAGANNGSQKGSLDVNRPETKVFYSDAKEIAQIIGQITNAADYGQFNINPGTPSTRSSGDLPVEDQLERLMQRLTETR